MLDAPDDLTPDDVAECLRAHWGLPVADVAYAPMGHGSCNWTIRGSDGAKWFVKADRSDQSDYHHATYETTARLRGSGLEVVHAAIRDRGGQLRRLATADWVIAVFPYLEGRNPDFFDDVERAEIAGAVGRMHAHPFVPEATLRWTPGGGQPELRQLLASGLDRPWNTGPFGEPARTLLTECVADIRALLALYDRLLMRLLDSDEPWVMTHGEPHGGNTMFDSTGQVRLIDCDDLLLAPRERDLWLLLNVGHQRPLPVDNHGVITAYQQHAGPITPRPDALELFRAEWHLKDISTYAQQFSQRHSHTADLAAHWKTLGTYLSTSQNWPAISRPDQPGA